MASMTPRHTNDAAVEPASLPKVPALTNQTPATVAPDLKGQCRAMITFLKRAHTLSLQSARSLGVPEEQLCGLGLERSRHEQIAALSEVRHSLHSLAPGHTGSFHDFIGAARSIVRHYRAELRKQQGRLSEEIPFPVNCSSPESTASDIAGLLVSSYYIANNAEQRNTTLAILSALVSHTKEPLPILSERINEQLAGVVAFVADQPRYFR